VCRDQGLEHFGEALGGDARPEALNGDAGPLDQQEQFIGEKLGIPQPRLATELNDQVANSAFASLDHAPGRVIRVRQFDRCIDEGAAGRDMACGLLTGLGLVQAGETQNGSAQGLIHRRGTGQDHRVAGSPD
jgi:hypothetical protein